ncbi:MAG: T9SS type A sorting domain-containing protein, partial [bacterium]
FSGNRHNIASNNSSRYVFRYNQVVGQDSVRIYAMTDAHGYSSWPEGSRSYEIYENHYSSNATNPMRTAIGIRGGDGVIFNNSCTNQILRTIELSVEGFTCGSTYPGRDQILSLYIWHNESHDDLGYTTNGVCNNCSTSILLNRDYFINAQPNGYIPYTYPHPFRFLNPVTNIELEHNNLVTVSPNPFNNSFSIKSDKTIKNVLIINTQGKTILSIPANSTLVEVNNLQLSPGFYFVRANIEGVWITNKMFKQ